jgi:hypothetical protein
MTKDERTKRKNARSKAWWKQLKSDPEKYAAHLERRRERKERNLESARRWKRNNPEKIRAYKKADRLKNAEAYRKREREYYAKNREHLIAREKRRRQAKLAEILAKNRALRAANPEKYRMMQAKHKLENPISWRLYGTRKSAKAKGVECDIDFEWFKVRFDAGVCELSGLPFDFVGKRSPNSPSVDRIDPNGPYTKQNCRLILWWLNRALVNMSDDYCLGVFRAIFIKRGEIAAYEDRMAA